jgi:polygalacturonase
MSFAFISAGKGRALGVLRMRRPFPGLSAALTVIVCTLGAAGQDTRNVTEPTLPSVCVILKAAMIAPHGISPEDERWVDTPRIQAAIDHCPQGQAVELSSDGKADGFLSGTLHLHKGVTLLIDKDVTLYASRNPRDYDIRRGSCGTVDDSGKKGCHALIEADHASHSGVMGEGVIDGRGGEKLLVNGVAETASWWLLAQEARIWGHQQVPRLIDTNHSDDFTVYQVTLRNSPGVHVGFHNADGLTVWGVKIDTPRDARNADGIDPSAARDVTVAESYIRAGNDNVAIKAGRKATRDVSILRNHFYWGHGMSIGSETKGGVSSVLVSDLSMDGPDNGIRIKSNESRGGLVKGVTYDDVCIRESKAPIMLDSHYDAAGTGRVRLPLYEDIVLRNVRVSGGGRLEMVGADSAHRIDARFDGVTLTDAASKYSFVSKHADILQGPGPVNFQLLGEDTTLIGRLGGDAPPPSCEAKFVPFPGDHAGVESAVAVAPHPVEERRPGRNQEIITLGRPASAPLAAEPVASVAGTAPPPQVVIAQVERRPKPTCDTGHCGPVSVRRVTQVRRSTLRCRRMHRCGARSVHRRVGNRRVVRRHHRPLATKVATAAHAPAAPAAAGPEMGFQAVSKSR